MNGQDSKTEIFDVFLCHNSEDKPAVREISKKLAEKNLKPFLDEADIRPADSWHSIIGKQIETVKAAAVFFGSHGVSQWQSREMIALLNQSDKRGCPVIPVILTSDTKPVVVPWSLECLHWVDFRATDSQPLNRLIWGITGQKPMELADASTSEKPTTMRGVANCRLIAGTGQQVVSGDAIPKTRLYPPLAEEPDKEQAAQLEILRRRVKEYWVDGLLRHSLYNEVLISLSKRQVDEFVDAPWKYTVEVSDAMSSRPLADRDVNAIYDATGLLLILGEPGSGKTTTLLDLARTLLERAKDDIKERVPIVLNLSSWKKQPLKEWISSELSEKYRVPRKIARFWLQHDFLLPLLDGLDEIEISTQPDCVTTINAFVEEFQPSGLVVCSRLMEYQWLPKRLKLNGAICLEPLSSEEVSKYLAAGGSKLMALREAVDTDPVLQELAQTPLMLSIMSLAYQGADGNELARQKGDSPEKRRKQIFGLYTEQMFKRKGATTLLFPKEKIISWLSWLAAEMREHSQSVFLVEGIQPNWLGPKLKQLTYGTFVALTLTLIFVIPFGFASALIFGMVGMTQMNPVPDSIIAAKGSVIEGLILGSLAGLAIFPGVTLGCRSDSALNNGVRSGLIAAASIGLIWFLFEFPQGRAMSELNTGLFLVLIIGLIAGVVGGFGISSVNDIVSVETIEWKWKQFLKMTSPGLILGFTVGFVSAFVCELVRGPDYDPWAGAFTKLFALVFAPLIAGVLWGEFIGLFFGVLSGLLGGFTDAVKADKAVPNQGIRLSRKNSLTVFLIVWLTSGPICVFLGWLIGGHNDRPVNDFRAILMAGILVGSIIGLIAGLNRGGSAVIKHYALRLVLWLNENTPFKFIQFLDQCAKLILLKKVMHRILLEYFADIPTQHTSVKRDSSISNTL